jgi:hypothetical protein
VTRLREGWDYLLYKIYIWGGLAALVVYILLAALVVHTDTQPGIKTFAGPISLYLFGAVSYWWWVFLCKGNRKLKTLVQERPKSHPELSALKSWNMLHQAMALYGGDTDELIKLDRAGRVPVLIWYGGVNGLLVWILGCLWLGWLGILPSRPGHDIPADPYFPIMVVGIFVWIAAMMVGTPLLAGWAGRSGEAAYLAPLGLGMVEVGSVPPEGAVVEGIRHGRLVHIETMGKQTLTVVQAKVPPFTIQSELGKLVADEGAPEFVIRRLKGLRKAKRWRGITVTGGAEGIAIRRESRGQNMWLYDLWLAERLLGNLDSQ